jgi:hypothetical protein|nr:hypothetical protein [uncultured Lachnoclostridium sp.]
MNKPKKEEFERVEIRCTKGQKECMKEIATNYNMTLTDHVINSATAAPIHGSPAEQDAVRFICSLANALPYIQKTGNEEVNEIVANILKEVEKYVHSQICK